jgi:hypothetical protein
LVIVPVFSVRGDAAKEAYNLLEGRAVFKELSNKVSEPLKAWIQLDFDNKGKNNNKEVRQYHEKYGYDEGGRWKIPNG